MQLERVALEDDYFVERKLYPNVDFYSGIIYRALGIATEMFTVMFALGRLPGWISSSGSKCVFTVTQLVDEDRCIKVLQNVITFLWKTDNFDKFIRRKPLKF